MTILQGIYFQSVLVLKPPAPEPQASLTEMGPATPFPGAGDWKAELLEALHSDGAWSLESRDNCHSSIL